MPQVSIVIPVFNDAARLRRALQSVVQQTVQDFEVFVVDDGSADDPESVVLGLADSRVRYLRNPVTLGPGGARNRGLSLANAPLLKALDSDDWLDPTFLERIDAVFREQPSVALVATGAIEHHEGDRTYEVARRNPGPDGLSGLCEGRAFQEFYFAGGSAGNPSQTALRTAWAREAGGWGEGVLNGDEGALWLRIVERRNAWFIDEPLAHITLHKTSTTVRASRAGLDAIQVAQMFRDVLRDIPALDTRKNRRALVRSRGYQWFYRGARLCRQGKFGAGLACWRGVAYFAPPRWWVPLFLGRASLQGFRKARLRLMPQ